MALELASIRGPARERHQPDFTGLRDRIDECRKVKGPEAANLADLRRVDWKARYAAVSFSLGVVH